MEIRSVAGPWVPLGIHLDFKHRKVEIHFIWWIITLGNTLPSFWCGECQNEIEEGVAECPHCGAQFDGEPILDQVLALIEDARAKAVAAPGPLSVEHFAALKTKVNDLFGEYYKRS